MRRYLSTGMTSFLSAALLLLPGIRESSGTGISGSFVQLNRSKVERTVNDWRSELSRIKTMGGNTVIVQWVAEEPVLYFQPADSEKSNSRLKGITERYDVLERIMDAAQSENVSVLVGLQHHPEYWTQITGRKKVIRDFFRVRIARNEKLQLALIDKFANHPAWKGYYIPDEIDDLNWRSLEKSELLQEYLRRMTEILKKNHLGKQVAVSAFFRGRTKPDLLVTNFKNIVKDFDIDILLLQDGVGTGDPPLEYLNHYYDAFQKEWKNEENSLPDLWCVVETFKQTSTASEPFAAEVANPERILEQVNLGERYFDHLILFTYDEYLNPSLGTENQSAFRVLQIDKE